LLSQSTNLVDEKSIKKRHEVEELSKIIPAGNEDKNSVKIEADVEVVPDVEFVPGVKLGKLT